ncbi:Double-stranded RNA-binding protein 4 [Striga hermonthica]|uniref:Double-stranded RNA-binding protein 4 n=1 Tax=Striga hermonthica TaxID=68872 RepID=A0A9N7RR83_STRHE|nr:Double-stranded RNA-binding protein 4 [Striga hermonthica]
MYKSKLQEFCQRCCWELPEYKTVRDGPDHLPRFTATVSVHGQVFETPEQCKSSKEAQNAAARIALEHLNNPAPPQVHHTPATASAPAAVNHQLQEAPPVTPVAPLPELRPAVPDPQLLPLSPLPSSLPIPPPGLLVPKSANSNFASEDILQQNCKDTGQASMVYRVAIGSNENIYKDTLHLYKNQLQKFAQKKNIGLPVYTTEAEGPPHARRFKSSVCVAGKSYTTKEFFTTLKEAEQAAARIACQELSVDVTQEDGGLYKTLLQELAQKRGLPCPSYETVQSGVPHRPLFSSTVVVGSCTFRGADAKTKKQAVMNAARAAYSDLSEPAEPSRLQSISVCTDAESSSRDDKASETTESHRDSTAEEAHLQAKRAKYSHESMNVNDDTRVPGSSEGKSDESTFNPKPVGSVLSTQEPCGVRSKTVVYSRKSNLPKPESASVLPFSDDEWVAYKVEHDTRPTAQK